MTSIKPPDGRPSAIPASSSGSSEPGAAERSGGPSFRQTLEQAGAAGQTQAPAGTASGAAATASADPIAELAQSVRSGALTAEQAIERLVDRAVTGVGAQLSPAQRAELTAVLRGALESDPALRELRDALE
jgi:hypothetical protein